MTPAQLRAQLELYLSDLLGEYRVPGLPPIPAIYVDDPPSDWVVTGLEVIVSSSEEFTNQGLHQHTAVITEIPVRVIPRASGSGAAAVKRIAQAFHTTNPTTVPGNESLGILTQYTLRVRS